MRVTRYVCDVCRNDFNVPSSVVEVAVSILDSTQGRRYNTRDMCLLCVVKFTEAISDYFPVEVGAYPKKS
jgi:hypothetical protein